MKVYVYRETNDNEVFGGELVKVFYNRQDAEDYLKARVEKFFDKSWEEVEEMFEEEDRDIYDTYVEYPNKNGFNFFAIDEHFIVGGRQ